MKPDPNEAEVTGMFQDEWSTPRRCGPTGSCTNHSFHRIPLCQVTQPIQNKMKQKKNPPPSSLGAGSLPLPLPFPLPIFTSSINHSQEVFVGCYPGCWGFQFLRDSQVLINSTYWPPAPCFALAETLHSSITSLTWLGRC